MNREDLYPHGWVHNSDSLNSLIHTHASNPGILNNSLELQMTYLEQKQG